MSIIEKLTEGVINRDLSRESNALMDKWEKTGLLEGIEGEHNRNSMSCLLENQAKELLREASTMAGGDVEGFAAVAFPIVRRVFGGLVANELVSVQPMSLPSGLIFFLDFTTANSKLGYEACDSIYGGGVVGAGIATCEVGSECFVFFLEVACPDTHDYAAARKSIEARNRFSRQERVAIGQHNQIRMQAKTPGHHRRCRERYKGV